jgi:Sec-independent protein secretion pathway component TatC
MSSSAPGDVSRSDLGACSSGSHHRAGTYGGATEPGTSDQARNDPGRAETEEERDDRNLVELLQELRVASIGVQVLFGFLLALPFSARFRELSHGQRDLYIAVVLLSALATAQLTAPVAYHRLVFRQHRKSQLLRMANILALTGLATVGIAICGAVFLVTSVVVTGIALPLIVAVTVCMFVGLWVVLPLVGRSHGRRSASDPGHADG